MGGGLHPHQKGWLLRSCWASACAAQLHGERPAPPPAPTQVLEVSAVGVGALVRVQAEGRIGVAQISKLEPYIQGTVVPLLDDAVADAAAVQAAADQLRGVMQVGADWGKGTTGWPDGAGTQAAMPGCSHISTSQAGVRRHPGGMVQAAWSRRHPGGMVQLWAVVVTRHALPAAWPPLPLLPQEAQNMSMKFISKETAALQKAMTWQASGRPTLMTGLQPEDRQLEEAWRLSYAALQSLPESSSEVRRACTCCSCYWLVGRAARRAGQGRGLWSTGCQPRCETITALTALS